MVDADSALRARGPSALRTSGRASVAELIGPAWLTGQALRPRATLLRQALSGRAAGTLSAELALSTWTTLASSGLARSALSRSALELWIAGGAVAELLGLPTRYTLTALLSATLLSASWATLAALSTLELRIAARSVAKLFWLATRTLTRAALTCAGTALAWTALRSTLSALLSLLELRATLPWPPELLWLALLPTLLAALTALLTALLPSRTRSARTSWSPAGRLAALLGLLAARLTLVLLFVLVLGVVALCNNQAAVSSTDAVERDAQLWNRNR